MAIDISRVRAVIKQMTLEEKVQFLGCGLSLKTAQSQRFKVFSLLLPDELLFYKPNLSAIGCAFDTQLAKDYGKLCKNLALDAQQLVDGVINLGVIRKPMKPGAETMLAEDPYVVSELADAFIEGAGSVIATNILSGEEAFEDRYMDARAMRELYFKPFETLKSKLAGATVPSGCLNEATLFNCKNFVSLVNELLPQYALLLNEAGSVIDRTESLIAGSTFEIAHAESDMRKVIKDVENGCLDEKRLDNAIERIIYFVASRYEDLKTLQESTLSYDFDKRIARISPVLLKNDGTLPLSPGTRIAVAGDLSKEEFSDLSTFLPTEKNRAHADTVIVFATPQQEDTSVGAAAEKALIAATDAGKKTVLVILSPRPLQTTAILPANAVLYVPKIYFYTFEAIVELLHGFTNPSGKLNVSWAFKEKDYPANLNTRAASRGMFCYESVYNGYRYFNSFKKGLQFPFGHGLSYTKFEYANLKITADFECVWVDYTVKNTGGVAGEHVSFVFCDLEQSPIYGLKSRLGAFSRVQLDKGKETTVRLKIPYERLSCFDAQNDKWVIPGGQLSVKIADSAEHIKISDTVKLPHGTRVTAGLNQKKIPSYYAQDRFAPLGNEIELLLQTSYLKENSEHAHYLDTPSKKKKQALEKTLKKRIQKVLKISHTHFNGLSEYAFDKILKSYT